MNRGGGGVVLDHWGSLRKFTSARIALGRAGGSLPTAELLGFALDHAAARDAVNAELDFGALQDELGGLGLPMAALASEARDRQEYLRRPDLGRRLCEESWRRWEKICMRDDLGKAHDAAMGNDLSIAPDVSIVVADGLSAGAAQMHAGAVLGELVPRLRAKGYRIGPLALARFGRVAVMDCIGAAMKARVGLILIGERPGLGAADSLGAYLVWRPAVGKTDAERNCVSNIRPGGLSPGAAAETIFYLIGEMARRGMSGVGLKDERGGLRRVE